MLKQSAHPINYDVETYFHTETVYRLPKKTICSTSNIYYASIFYTVPIKFKEFSTEAITPEKVYYSNTK